MSHKSIFLSILSAVLLILAYPKPDLGFLAWFALAPWFFALQEEKPLRAFFLSYLVGLIFFAGTLYWVTYVSYLGFTVLVLYLAVYFAVFGLSFSFLIDTIDTGCPSLTLLFFIPSIWVTLEYIRSHLFSGFGWALLGYTQYTALPIIQISDITGAYGVSFLLVLVNVGIWQTLTVIASPEATEGSTEQSECRAKQSQDERLLRSLPASLRSRLRLFAMTREATNLFFSVFCILFSMLLVLGYGYARMSQPIEGKYIKVATIQGNIPQGMKWDPQARDTILKKYFDLTRKAYREHPDIIVWPETSMPGYLEEETDLWQKVVSLSKEISPAYLLLGAPQQGEQGQIYNSAALLFAGEVIDRYDKLHLVPFGEFIPCPGFFSRFSFSNLIGDFTPGENYTVFDLAQTAHKTKLSALICFEDVFSYLARGFRQRGAQVLVNITNDAWFGASSEPYQHVQASVFRAVENHVHVIRSANTGVSCFINPWGKILSRVSDDLGRDILVEGQAVKDLQVIDLTTFYSTFGDVFAWLCIVTSLISFFIKA